MTTWRDRPASAKAGAFLLRLADERDPALFNDGDLTVVEEAREGRATGQDVSVTIDRMMQMPRRARAATPGSPDPVTEPGFYVAAETLYRVQESRSSKRLYAKVLVVTGGDGDRKGRFEYAPGAVFRLTAAARLTAEQAARFGHAYGFCVRCTAALDDPRSVYAGYGQTCAAREGWPYPTAA